MLYNNNITYQPFKLAGVAETNPLTVSKDVGGRTFRYVLSMASGSTGKDNVLVALRSSYGKSI